MNTNNSITIAIASGKGGTGKTLISTNLAAMLRQNSDVLLVDLDVEEPNDALFISDSINLMVDSYKMVPKWDENACTFCGNCTNNCKFHAVLKLGNFVAVFNELCHSCYACSDLCPTNALPMSPHLIGQFNIFNSSNFSFLESRLALTEEQAVPLINKTKNYVSEFYSHHSFRIFDCPPGTSCPMVAATKDADLVLLITEPTSFGLNDLTLAVETMRLLKKDFAVIINRDGSGDSRVDDYCSSENIPIVARIPFDKQIAFHYANGHLVYDKIESVRVELGNVINFINDKRVVYA